jgi:hypothetical protein
MHLRRRAEDEGARWCLAGSVAIDGAFAARAPYTQPKCPVSFRDQRFDVIVVRQRELGTAFEVSGRKNAERMARSDEHRAIVLLGGEVGGVDQEFVPSAVLEQRHAVFPTGTPVV